MNKELKEAIIKAGYVRKNGKPNYQILAGKLETTVQSIYNWIGGKTPIKAQRPKLREALNLEEPEYNKIMQTFDKQYK